MSKIEIDPVCRRRMQPQYYTRNGQLVSASLQADMAALVNQIARYRGKEYARFGGDVVSLSTSRLYRFAGHIGPMAGTMVARIPMAPATQVTQTSNPYMQLTLYDTSGNYLTSGRARLGYSYGAVPQNVPQEWGCATIGINVSAYRDTSFRAVLQANEEARPIGCTVYEVPLPPDTDNGYLNQMVSVGQPILDEDRAAIVDLATALYKRGGPAMFTFSSDSDASAAQFVFSAYDTFGTMANGTFRLDQNFCSRKTVSTIPVKLECYAGYSGAGSGNIRLVDMDGNVYATFAISGAAGWQTAKTANLVADQRVYKIEGNSDGVNIMNLYALSCFRYQS